MPYPSFYYWQDPLLSTEYRVNRDRDYDYDHDHDHERNRDRERELPRHSKGFCIFLPPFIWLFALLLSVSGYYGTNILLIGSSYSQVLKTNSWIVSSIKLVNEKRDDNIVLYGLSSYPKLNVMTNWEEQHNIVLDANNHKAFPFWLNKGSKIVLVGSTQPSESFLNILIKISEGLQDWMMNPIQRKLLPLTKFQGGDYVLKLEYEAQNNNVYYVNIVNFNTYAIKLGLIMNISAMIYNTSSSTYTCSLRDGPCTMPLSINSQYAVLTSPTPLSNSTSDMWKITITYGIRWFSYMVVMAFGIIVGSISYATWKRLSITPSHQEDDNEHVVDDDWGDDEEEEQEGHRNANDLESPSMWINVKNASYYRINNTVKDGDNEDEKKDNENDDEDDDDIDSRLCIVCVDAQRNCFFIPCGHFSTCFKCGVKIQKGKNGSCPICRGKIERVKRMLLP